MQDQSKTNKTTSLSQDKNKEREFSVVMQGKSHQPLMKNKDKDKNRNKKREAIKKLISLIYLLLKLKCQLHQRIMSPISTDRIITM